MLPVSAFLHSIPIMKGGGRDGVRFHLTRILLPVTSFTLFSVGSSRARCELLCTMTTSKIRSEGDQ